MNIKSLAKHRWMLAAISGAVIFTTLGLSAATYALADTNQTQNSGTNNLNQPPPTIQGSIDLKQMLMSSIKTKFSDAANTAASTVSNGVVIGGSISVMQGYLVYQFKVVDDKNMIYSIVIDAGTGKVLYTSQGHSMNAASFLGMNHGGYMHKFHMGGFKHQWQQQPQQQPQQQQSYTVPENPALGV